MSGVLHTVLETQAYLAQASKIMSDAERAEVIDALSRAPLDGDVIKGTGGLRKMRVALQGRGKSGGARVIYWFHSERFPVALLWVFAKNQAANITASQAVALAKAGASILESIGVKQ